MIEAILILNIIILAIVLLMVPVVIGTNQKLDKRKADSRKIRETHDYIYELMRRDLVKKYEAEIAGMKKHFEEGGGYLPDPEEGSGSYPYSGEGRESVTEAEAVEHTTKTARWLLYKLDCTKHNYLPFKEGADPKWPGWGRNWGHKPDWRFQEAAFNRHENRDTR